MSALDAFRRERGLLSGDDLDAWLRAAGLEEEEWAQRVLAGDTAGLPGPVRGRAEAPARRGGSCGDAALRVVCRVLGVPHGTSLGPDATLLEIVEAARAAGLAARALKVSHRQAAELPGPWIAHVDDAHWVVVHRAGAETVVVSDPACGAGTLSRSGFEARWSGWCAVFGRGVQSD